MVIVQQDALRANGDSQRSNEIMKAVLDMSCCKCVEDLHQILADICDLAGFAFFCYQDYRIVDGKPRVGCTLSNYPESWQHCYRERQYLIIDPVVQHAMSSLAPLTWCDQLFVTEAEREFRKELRVHGMGLGVSFPAHFRHTDVACVSFVRSTAEADEGVEPVHVPSWGALVANLTLDTSRRLNVMPSGAPCLSARELEILKWVAEGKSSWDISRIVSLTEHGVVHHIRNIMKKFDVTSRRRAVLMASKLGML
ncbi:LuxR family transcriptional regulator [Burkholderia lata]|uniref:helix-turn-helix transcriptional regulator n=1 Tax=Burkholderia lata (strain ATCC 17760 / DSM 23089 / LMG 22485 / NCIMB 9086 / R18194 / 383) TaxID=482957 RepID=UPI001452D7B2|nr:autoinducer binding domain-containing protein [Burkholderia lata]VWC78203.1 LuxR family transcriptional regulator [Burkholderia lata]